MDLVKPTAKIYSRGFEGNLFCIFLNFIKIYMNFKSLNNLWDLNQFERKENPAHSTVLKAAHGPAAKAV
jgi:hypothetical protein